MFRIHWSCLVEVSEFMFVQRGCKTAKNNIKRLWLHCRTARRAVEVNRGYISGTLEIIQIDVFRFLRSQNLAHREIDRVHEWNLWALPFFGSSLKWTGSLVSPTSVVGCRGGGRYFEGYHNVSSSQRFKRNDLPKIPRFHAHPKLFKTIQYFQENDIMRFT